MATRSSPEVYLISAILRTGDITTALQAGIDAEQFHACRNEWTWLTDYLIKHRKVPSKVAFRQQFPAFTIKAVDDVGHYTAMVRSNHARRELTKALRTAADMLAVDDIDAAVAHMHHEIVSISASMGSATDDSDIITNWEDTFKEVSGRVERVGLRGMAGIPTGFATLDERTGGPQPGHIWVVAARLNVGKSWAMVRMATAAIMDGYAVQYNALEQTRADVSMRIHTFLSGSIGKELFRNLDLSQGRNFDLDSYKAFLTGMKDHVEGRLHVSDTSRGRVSPLTIAAQIERNRPDIVFIDYLTLMEKTGTGDWLSVAKLSADVKEVAMRYNIPIVVASQLNRERGIAKRGEPVGAEAISQSDAVGQDADAVVTMAPVSKSVLAMKLVKYRHGLAGFKWFTQFQPSEGIFKEISHDKAMTLKDQDDDQEDNT